METQEKPTAAFVLSLVGGILIVIGSLLEGIIGALLEVSFPGFGVIWAILAGLGIMCAVLVLVGAAMLYVNPKRNVPWGVIIIVFSVLSLFFALGGLIVGMILGIIGGALGVAWKPSPTPLLTPTAITRVCPQCGRVLTEEVKFCPYCGKALE